MRWPVYRGRVRVAWMEIDDADLPLVESHLWRLHSHGYPYTYPTRHGIGLHRLLMGLDAGDSREVDHISGEPLDNRRSNLRIVTHAENGQNITRWGAKGTSRYRGVYWASRDRKWRAQTRLNGKRHSLGDFDSELDAARAVSAWRQVHHPFAPPDDVAQLEAA